MKAIVVYALALATLANGQTGIEKRPNVEFDASPSNSYNPWRDTSANQICKPGSIKSLDCNSCFCTSDGLNWGCTLMACPPDDSDQNNRSRNKREIEAQLNDELETSPKNPYDHLLRTRRPTLVCKPQTFKYEDCNSCFCMDDGSGWACTEMACPPGGSNQNLQLRSERGIEAHSNDELETSANNPYDYPLGITKPNQICEPGTTKSVDCNSCFCTRDGLHWGCTLMACRPKQSVPQ